MSSWSKADLFPNCLWSVHHYLLSNLCKPHDMLREGGKEGEEGGRKREGGREEGGRKREGGREEGEEKEGGGERDEGEGGGEEERGCRYYLLSISPPQQKPNTFL